MKGNKDVMRNVVLWSGGLDSTMMVHDLSEDATEKNPLYTITIDGFPQICNLLLKKQKEARKNFIKRFKLKKKIKRLSITVSITGDNDSFYIHQSDGLPQPVIWLGGLINFIQNDDTIYMAYICGDDFWHYREHFVSSFQSLLKIKNVRANLEFPYEFNRKSGILNKAKQKKIPKTNYWYCESPKESKRSGKLIPCRKCGCCIAHRLAECELEFSKEKYTKLKLESDCIEGS